MQEKGKGRMTQEKIDRGYAKQLKKIFEMKYILMMNSL